jgi:alpha-beta hydrolase superfamily lysophospholipase
MIKEGLTLAARFLRRVKGLLLCLPAFLLTACLPTVQEFHPAVQSPVLEEKQVVASDGANLPLRAWLPEQKPWAVVLALHGFNDYSRGFEPMGQYLSSEGVAVYAFDQRGFGAAPRPGIWAGIPNLSRDLRDAVSVLRERYPTLPLYVLGESMGAAIAAVTYAESDAPPVNGLIFSAPAVWGNHQLPLTYRMVLNMGAYTLPWKKVTGKNLNILATDNIPALVQMGKDPLVIKATRIDAIHGMVKLMDEAAESAPRLKTPLMIVYGKHDQVIPRRPVRAFVDELETPYRLSYYANGYHLLLRDLQYDVVMEDLLAWMRNPAEPLPSGFDSDWEKFLPPLKLKSTVKSMTAQNEAPDARDAKQESEKDFRLSPASYRNSRN